MRKVIAWLMVLIILVLVFSVIAPAAAEPNTIPPLPQKKKTLSDGDVPSFTEGQFFWRYGLSRRDV